MGGVATSIQHPMTAKGFVFLALEDETGMMNITLRPDVYRRYRAVLHRHPLLVIDGRLQVEGAVLNVVARHLEPVEAVIAEPADPARQARFDLTKQRRMFR
jgi:error-prone DNA polymerase